MDLQLAIFVYRVRKIPLRLLLDLRAWLRLGLKIQEEPKRKKSFPQGNELLNFGNLTKIIMYTFFSRN
jgi:hypothetical protein